MTVSVSVALTVRGLHRDRVRRLPAGTAALHPRGPAVGRDVNGAVGCDPAYPGSGPGEEGDPGAWRECRRW